MPDPVWYKSLYWRIAFGFVAMLAALLLAQGLVLVWLTDRVVGWSAQSPEELVSSVAADLSTALTKNPSLPLDTYVRDEFSHIYRPFVVVMVDGRAASNRPNGLPPGYIRAVQQRLRRGEPLNSVDPRDGGRGGRGGRDCGSDRRREPGDDPGRGGPLDSARGGPLDPARGTAGRRDAADPSTQLGAGPADHLMPDRATGRAVRAARRVLPSSSVPRRPGHHNADRIRRHSCQSAAGVRRDSRARTDADVGGPGAARDWRGERGAADLQPGAPATADARTGRARAWRGPDRCPRRRSRRRRGQLARARLQSDGRRPRRPRGGTRRVGPRATAAARRRVARADDAARRRARLHRDARDAGAQPRPADTEPLSRDHWRRDAEARGVDRGPPGSRAPRRGRRHAHVRRCAGEGALQQDRRPTRAGHSRTADHARRQRAAARTDGSRGWAAARTGGAEPRRQRPAPHA